MSDLFNLDDMLDSYLYENRQLLEQLQNLVLENKDATHFDQRTIHKIFRTMHTIKGSSGIMMFDSITKVSHKLEDVFSVIRESQPEHVPQIELVEYVLEVADFISTELDKVENGVEVNGDADTIVSKLDTFVEEINSKSNGVVRERYVTDGPAQQYYIAPAKTCNFIDLESSVEEIEARAEKSKYVQVDIAKMEQLVELVKALVISQSEVLNHPNDFEAAIQMMDISADLQDVIDSICKVPLTNIFHRMNRIVFDASRKLGKEIDLIIEGEETEVDRNIAEQLADPLMHLIRNAVDHGIELPQERISTGKNSRGKIFLSAHKDDDNVWVVIEDDGRGMKKESIYLKARAMGIIDSDKSVSDYTEKEVFAWITTPGFSTKESVSEYSGRGVGLDVVASNLVLLNGHLEIESEEGRGSKMILQIPLRMRY